MKHILFAILMAIPLSAVAAGSNYVPPPSTRPEAFRIVTITRCIEGYKFALTFVNSVSTSSQRPPSMVQIYERIPSTNTPVPMKCTGNEK